MLVVILAAAIFYFILIVLSDIDKVVAAADHFEWVYILPAISLIVANYLVRAERWHYYLNRTGLGLPRKKSYWLFLSGFAMLITPAKAGEAIKALLLKVEKNAPIERGVAIVFAERMTDIIGMIILIAIGSFAITYGLVPFSITVVAVIVILLALNVERFSSGLARWLQRRPGLERVGRFLGGAVADARTLLRGKNLWTGTGFALAGWALESLAFYLVLRGCAIDATELESVFIYSFSLLIGALSMLPGGMGTTEAIMVGLLVAIPVAASSASFAVILMRICALWLAVSVGVVSLAIYSRRSPIMIEPSGAG